MPSVYFISDLHLGHKNTLKFGQRNHLDIEHMHIKMVEEWNEKVRKQSDIVWVLGDVAFNPEALKWLDCMNGQKRLILGNHDTMDLGLYRKYFKEVSVFHKGYKGMILTHIPIHPSEMDVRFGWNWNIHGHIHHEERNNLGEQYYNVNVDIIGYQPIHLDELRKELAMPEGGT